MRASRQPLKHSSCMSDSRLQLIEMYGDITSRSSPHDMLARGIRSQMAWTGRLRSLA